MSDRRRNARQADPTPLFSESAERNIIGICLTSGPAFWEAYGKLAAEDFAVPRLSRIWDAMCRVGQAGRPVNRNYVPLFIQGDSGEDTPLMMFLSVLINDAPPTGDADAEMETVLHLSNKRKLIDSLERAKQEIIRLDVGTPVEHMVDTGVRHVSTSVNMDFDKDLRTYYDWGLSQANKVYEAYKRGEDSGGVGLSCGLRAVEEVIGRMLPGKVYVLAGMSSAGKSALARQMLEGACTQAIKEGLGWGYVASLEMQGEEYATRHLAEQLGIPGSQIEQGDLNPAEIEALTRHVEKMRRLPILIDQRPRLNMELIRSRMMRAKMKYGKLFLGVFDHLLLIKGGKYESATERIAEASMETKNLAKELDIPIILLAQLNEKAILERPSGRPNSSDLFGGQAIQQNTDVTLFVHRQEVVEAKREPSKTQQARKEGDPTPHEKWVRRMDDCRNKAVVYNNKRRGGAGSVSRDLLFDGPTMTFRDL